MNKAEAKAVLDAELAKYRSKPYRELAALVGSSHRIETTASSGNWYQIAVQALWDDPKKPNDLVRIAGAIDDGGVRAYVPLTNSFLISPNGELVGE
jgi:hypothetical protein